MNNHSKQTAAILERLYTADPCTADEVSKLLEGVKTPISSSDLAILVEDTIWGLSLEESFGKAIASGYIDLLKKSNRKGIPQYRKLLYQTGEKGPALGRFMAVSLVPVLMCQNKKIMNQFLHTVNIMTVRGTYTLNDPIKAFTLLLIEKDYSACIHYLSLLAAVFTHKLTYGRYRHFTQVLPKAVLSFHSEKRSWQIAQLNRLLKIDIRLLDLFLRGMENGLNLLSEKALDVFVAKGVKKYNQNSESGKKFISLDSRTGIDAYESMRVTILLPQIISRLSIYTKARIGRAISFQPLSAISKSFKGFTDKPVSICSSSDTIYLPDEISLFTSKEDNLNLYKCLTRFETGHHEFMTYDFDLEKLFDRHHEIYHFAVQKRKPGIFDPLSQAHKENIPDLNLFFMLFPCPLLAADLFTMFEQGRIRKLLSQHYPGMVKKYLPVIQSEAVKMCKNTDPGPLLVIYMYVSLAMECDHKNELNISKKIRPDKYKITTRSVYDSAILVYQAYDEIEQLMIETGYMSKCKAEYTPLETPFNRRLHPDLFFYSDKSYETLIRKIKIKLGEKGIKGYKSDIRKKCVDNKGSLTFKDIQSVILKAGSELSTGPTINNGFTINPEELDMGDFYNHPDTETVPDINGGTLYLYKEWDHRLSDYLDDHVRIIDRTLSGTHNGFYTHTMKKHHGLVRKVRNSFELLKPEGLKILRQWIEGDEFDYNALIDFAIDLKCGLTPSDRLYLKRIKQQRDVSVMLLVDLSRSTANNAYGTTSTVLEVEKEAIILLSQALQVLGDKFGIAGFSGSGRLGVDYFHIKDFHEVMDSGVKNRINSMSPQRNTRMGAAIRHAAAQLKDADSKVRLIIILGDGFPNDVDYKRKYAMEDTRKAISELRSKNIFVHAITVNITEDPKLDQLYGNIHHNIISDVTQLPDKLLRIYSKLTKQ